MQYRSCFYRRINRDGTTDIVEERLGSSPND
jgi:hypothetical protein